MTFLWAINTFKASFTKIGSFPLKENESPPLEKIANIILFEEKKRKDPVATKLVYKYFSEKKL
jgi:hypothetical protein